MADLFSLPDFETSAFEATGVPRQVSFHRPFVFLPFRRRGLFFAMIGSLAARQASAIWQHYEFTTICYTVFQRRTGGSPVLRFECVRNWQKSQASRLCFGLRQKDCKRDFVSSLKEVCW